MVRLSLLIAAALILVFGVIGKLSGDRDETRDARAEAEGLLSCQYAVKARLTNPETLDWHWTSRASRQETNGGYLFREDFTAENSFGVPKKYRMTCAARDGRVSALDIRETL